MKSDVLVSTRNVLLLREAVERAMVRRPGSGRFVLAEGPAGSGKSENARALADQLGGLLHRVEELETTRSMLSALVYAANGWEVSLHNSRALFGRLLEDLEEKHYPALIFDEADRLLRPRSNGISLLEVIRDLHDRSRSPIILFSIGPLGRRLANPGGGYGEEAFATRIAAHLRFERASIEDAELLAVKLLEGVKLDGSLIANCVSQSGGSLRPLLSLFSEIERVAKTAEITTVTLAKWEQLRGYAGLPATAPRRVTHAAKAVA